MEPLQVAGEEETGHLGCLSALHLPGNCRSATIVLVLQVHSWRSIKSGIKSNTYAFSRNVQEILLRHLVQKRYSFGSRSRRFGDCGSFKNNNFEKKCSLLDIIQFLAKNRN
ncbi:hypothetical protein CEXT_136251 [Caerostris extrusa]|uniref:Uncharacterized protein n=1 Tax=Caerostris extrusa TaxID=172846 RepID=A0AAV4VJM3_CAEEX|nr:hypothetical protein CEXT_136251 [Caerostris extrusa]